MKKIALLLVIIMLFGLFTGCHSKPAEKEPSEEPKEETFYCPAPLTKSEFARLLPTKAEFWADFRFWSEDNPSAVYRYYGTYNGYGVMAVPTQISTTNRYIIGDYIFLCRNHVLEVYKDGEAISLESACKQGLITDKDLETIYNYHKLTEPEFYPPESGE